MFNETQYMRPEEIPDPSSDLTEEDKKYLVMKWGSSMSQENGLN